MFRLAWAFFRRDGWNASPVLFLAGWIQVILSVVFWFFLTRFLQQGISAVHPVLPVDYFTFGLVGLVLSQYVWRSFSSFANRLKALQVSGAFETLWVTPQPFLLLIVLFGVWNFVCTTIYAATILWVGVGWLGAHLTFLQAARVLAIGMVVSISAECFALLVISCNLAFGFGDGFRDLLSRGMVLISGTFFPVQLLPAFLRSLALLLPITQGLLLARRSVWAASPVDRGHWEILVFLTAVLMFLTFLVWRQAVRMARVTGRMTSG